MKKHILVTAIVLAILAPASMAQTIIRHTDTNQTLLQRVDWSQNEARQRSWKNVWVGYSIDRLMHENSHMGHFGRGWRDQISLQELITGEKPDDASGRESVRSAARRVLDEIDKDRDRPKVPKEIAILLRFNSAESDLDEVKISNLTLPVDLDDTPLVWLGSASDDESIRYLEGLFEESTGQDEREDVVTAVGIHDAKQQAFAFLRKVLTGRDGDDVRENAAFWMGQQNTQTALALLLKTAETDRSEDVREQAVFGISQLDMESATDALIDLARNSKSSTVRDQAIFWLGQEASNKSIVAVESAAYNDAQTEVQKQAVFALMQADNDEGVPILIKLAKTHKNPEVRKQAIFWLSQSQDSRALDALIEFVRGS